MPYPGHQFTTYILHPPGDSQLLEVREVRGLAPGDVLMLVVMEWCDLGSLATAVARRKFQPHGKWGFHTTYVCNRPPLNPRLNPCCLACNGFPGT